MMVVLTLLVAAGVLTWIALEGKDVVVLRTFDAHGHPRDTRTWIAEEDGAQWIEAANADRGFLHDVTATAGVELHRAGADPKRCQAQIMANPPGHERIRRLLATKYGWADTWVGWLTDTSGSIALRLECQ